MSLNLNQAREVISQNENEFAPISIDEADSRRTFSSLENILTATIELENQPFKADFPIAAYAEYDDKSVLLNVGVSDGKFFIETPKGVVPVQNSGIKSEDLIRLMIAFLQPSRGSTVKVVVMKNKSSETGVDGTEIDNDFASTFHAVTGMILPQVFADGWNIDPKTQRAQCGCWKFNFCKNDPNKKKRESCNALQAQCNSGSNCTAA